MTRDNRNKTITMTSILLAAVVGIWMSACSNQVVELERTIATSSAALEGNPPICILGEDSVKLSDRAAVGADVAAGTYLEVGSQAVLTGDGYVGGNAFIRSNGTVDGDLSLEGVLSVQGDAYTITGTLEENAVLDMPTLDTKTVTAGGDPITVQDGETLVPGTYGAVTIAHDAVVTVDAGVYNLVSLNVQPNVDLILDGDVEVNIAGNLELGDHAEIIGDAALNAYVDGAQVQVRPYVTFNGILVAPNADVFIYSGVAFNGCVGGENVTLEPDVSFDSNGLSLVGAEPTCDDGVQNGDEEGVDCGGSCPDECAPTCDDGIQNGDEEGVDCGGSFCPVCPTCDDGVQNGDEEGVDCGGSFCDACPTCDDGIQNGDEEGVDCGGSFCDACPTCDDGIQNGDEEGVDCGGSCPDACPEETVDISVTFDVFNDWGSGYCAVADVTNNGTVASTTWSLTFLTGGTWIYNSWNGDFSAKIGQVTVTPLSWNSVIAPGETISSVGFCAMRFWGGNGLPSVVSTTGE